MERNNNLTIYLISSSYYHDTFKLFVIIIIQQFYDYESFQDNFINTNTKCCTLRS